MAGTQFAVDLVFKTQGGSQIKAASQSLDKVSNAAKKAQGSVNQASNNIRRFGQSSQAASEGTSKLGASLGSLVTKLAAVTAATVGVKESLTAAFERGNAEKRLQNLTGSTAEYEQALRLAAISSKEFGTTQTEATKALGDVYSRLSGVGYGLTEVSEIYKGFNVIAAQSGVASEDAAGAFLQLSQALGSGKLQGDELRSILERMPQLAQAIAAEMGIAAGEVRKAGADGLITGEVMYAALKKASEGSFDLSKTLTTQQATMNEVKQEAEALQVELGKAFAPVLLTTLKKFAEYAKVAAKALENLNKWATENAESIGRVVKVGLEIGKIGASVLIVAKAYALWQKAVAGVAAAKAALLAMTGVGLVKVGLGVTAAAGTYALLSKGVGDVEKAVKDLQIQEQESLETTKELAKENEDLYRKQGEVTDAVKETSENLKETKETHDQITQSQDKELQKQLKIKEAANQTRTENAANKVKVDEIALATNTLAANTEKAATAAKSYGDNMTYAANAAQRAAQAAAAANGAYKSATSLDINSPLDTLFNNQSSNFGVSGMWGASVTNQDAINHVLSRNRPMGAYQNDNGDWLVDPSNPHYTWSSTQRNETKQQIKEVQRRIEAGELVMGPNGTLTTPRDAQYRQSLIDRNAASLANRTQSRQATQVSVNYSGSTLNLGDENYIKTNDVDGIVQQAVTAMNTNLQQSSKTRLNLGI